MIVYRGTQKRAKKGVRGVHSYTDSLAAALIYSAVPPGMFGRPPARFLPTSTVHAIDLDCRNALDLHGELDMSFDSLIWKLQYGKPDGITHEEALRVLAYLHNRLIGKAPGGDFAYKVYDEDMNLELDEADLPLSILAPITLISSFYEDFEYLEGFSEDEVFSSAARLRADTFIYMDSKTVQRVAKRLGYDCLIYSDPFSGSWTTGPALLGLEPEQMDHVEMLWDLDMDKIPAIDAYRPLSLRPIRRLWSKPSLRVLAGLQPR